MSAVWDAVRPAIPGIVVALVGLAGTIWVALTNHRAARALAQVTAGHTLRTQRALERDKAARERRSKRIDGLLEQAHREVEEYITLQSALESADVARIEKAMEPFRDRHHRPIVVAVAAVPEPQVRAAFHNLSSMMEGASFAIAETLMARRILTPISFNNLLLPVLQQLAVLDAQVDEYVLGSEP